MPPIRKNVSGSFGAKTQVTLFADRRIVPVLMFHSVGLDNQEWVFSYLSDSLHLFEEKLKCLVEHRFSTIFWNDLYQYMGDEKNPRDNSIMLTFDDGYLDNWVFVYPLLKKYSLKTTVFVNPDFVDPCPNPRLNLEDVWKGRCSYKDLHPAGFLSWAELREMEASGLVDVQSHALTHTWYFSGPRIVDFHTPRQQSPYPWLFWNQRPERKPFYLTENQQKLIPYGHPIFEHEKALVARRYYPDERFITRILEYISSKGWDFYQKHSWKEDLTRYAEDIRKNRKFEGHYEMPEERYERVKKELSESKNLIERNLNKDVDFICWPGGAYDETVKCIGREVGYKAWTLSSRDFSSFRNVPGANPENVKRMGSSSRITIKGHGNAKGAGFYLLLNIRTHQNSLLSKYFLRAYKLFSILTCRG